MKILARVGLTLLAGCASAGAGDLTGPLSEERLRRVAEEAGFRVRELNLVLPTAHRPTLPFTTLPFQEPTLQALREKYGLEKVVDGAKDEWTAQLRLKEWVSKAIPDGQPRVRAIRADDILVQAGKGETFYCTHFAITYVECALALGWQARKIAVDRRHGPEGRGSTHHGVAEVWSNQHGKWVVIDPQSNLHFEKAGVPLSAWDIRAEWLVNGGKAVDRVVGVAPNAVRRNPAIRWWDRPGEDETSAFFWVYVEDHVASQGGKLIFPQDPANEGLTWYQNDSKSDGSVLHTGYRTNRFLKVSPRDAYWTVGVTEVSIAGVKGSEILLSLDSHLPDRVGYEVLRSGCWERVPDGPLTWPLMRLPAANAIKVRAVGPRGVTGPESSLFLTVE